MTRALGTPHRGQIIVVAEDRLAMWMLPFFGLVLARFTAALD